MYPSTSRFIADIKQLTEKKPAPKPIKKTPNVNKKIDDIGSERTTNEKAKIPKTAPRPAIR